MKITIVLPAYNESESISGLLENFETFIASTTYDIRLLVVNDGSKDDTVQKVQAYISSLPIDIIDNPENKGLGSVLSQGLFKAVELSGPGDIICTMDADNSHLPSHLTSMIEKINSGYDVVIASRYQKGAQIYGLNNFRIFTSFMAGSLFLVLAQLKGVRDYTCGYRAYTYEVLNKGKEFYKEKLIEESGFACMVELLLKLDRFNPKYCEIPMTLRYDLKLSPSKMKIWATIKKTFAVLYRYKKGFKS